MENLVPITPVNFFQLRCDCRYLPLEGSNTFRLNPKNYNKYLLPDTSGLTHEEKFADVAVGWNEEGLEIYVATNQPFEKSTYPQLEKGDSLEICIDTRNIKTSGYNTRFCHHFFSLAETVDGRVAGEITRFRTEDIHELCEPKALHTQSTFKKNSYSLQFMVPSQCLFGYDPAQSEALGFTYRINRAQGDPQHFSVTSGDYQFEQQPSLWANLRLVR